MYPANGTTMIFFSNLFYGEIAGEERSNSVTRKIVMKWIHNNHTFSKNGYMNKYFDYSGYHFIIIILFVQMPTWGLKINENPNRNSFFRFRICEAFSTKHFVFPMCHGQEDCIAAAWSGWSIVRIYIT